MKDIAHKLFDLRDVEAYADFARFRFHLVAISQPALSSAQPDGTTAAADSAGECVIAIATEKHLLLSDNAAAIQSRSGSASSSGASSGINQIVLKWDERFGRPTALEWVSSQIVCVGFESGYFSCYTCDGLTLIEERLDTSPLNSIKLHSFGSGDGSSGSDEQSLCLLHESSLLLSIPLSEIADYKIRSVVKIKFVDRPVSCDFAFLPQPFSNSGALLLASGSQQQGSGSPSSGGAAQASSSGSKYAVAIAGMDSALALYNVGGETHFQHFGKAVDFYKESLAASVRSMAMGLASFLGRGPASPQSVGGRPTIDGLGVDENEGLAVHETALTAAVDFEDPKRRILRVSADPRGRLLACADSLGRVLLCDARSFTVVRCWKGVREARLAWGQGGGSAAGGGLSLAIFAPQLGLLSVYAMAHGPQLRSIAVGSHCHIFTTQLVVGPRSYARCCLLRYSRGHVVVSTVGPGAAEDAAGAVVDKQIRDRCFATGEPCSDGEGAEGEGGFADCVDGSEEGERALVRAFRASLRRWLKEAPTSTAAAADSELEASLLSMALHLHSLPALAECIDAITAAEGGQGFLLGHAAAATAGAPRAVFSAHFSGELARLLMALCLLCDEPPASALRQEAGLRVRLAQCYSALLDISSQRTGASLGGDEVEGVLRQRGLRAEALLWLRRREGAAETASSVVAAADRSRRRLSSDSAFSVTPTSPLRTRSRESFGSYSSAGRSESREGPGQQGSRIVRRTSFSSQQGEEDAKRRLSFGSGSASEDAPIASSPAPSSAGSPLLPTQRGEGPACSFSSFRALFAPADGGAAALGPAPSGAALRLLLCALLGDCSVFSLREYASALQAVGLGGGLGLRALLPLLACCMAEAAPALGALALQELLVKQPSSSPLQRYLRDCLLEIQDEYSEIVSALNSAFGEKWTLYDVQQQEEATALMPLLRSASHSLQDSPAAMPTFEDVALHVLQPLWRCLHKSAALECAMALCTVVLETLQAAGEQAERRTFGACSVSRISAAFDTLFKQLRVALLLASRSSRPLTVDHLDAPAGSGSSCTIYQLLAEDSLRFSILSEEAREHEGRCRDVFSKSASVSGVGSALLAWGAGADRRWPELLSAASEGVESGDSGGASAAEDRRHSKLRRRRPLLLFFPHHNYLSALATYRGFLLGARWAQTPRKIRLLSLVVSHLYPLPAAVRAAAAERVCAKYIFPFLSKFLESRRDYSVDGADASADGSVATALQEVIYFLGHPALLRELTRGCAEVMAYCQVDEATLQQLADPWMIDSALGDSSSGLMVAERPALWPPQGDPFLSQIFGDFASHRGCRTSSIRAHVAALWVLELRASCGLLGVPLSNILYTGAEDQLFAEGALRSSVCSERLAAVVGSDAASVDVAAIRAARLRFLQQCFQRSPEEHPHLAYMVGEAWSVPEDSLRLFHLETLLARGGSDGLVEQLMSRVSDKTRLLDCLVESLRSRLGSTLVIMDRVPALLPAIAAMDAEAYTWVRSSCLCPPDAALVAAIARGEQPLTGFNAASTKHLVTALQGLCVAGSGGGRDDGWIERRRCVEHLSDVSRHVLVASQQQVDKAAAIISLRDEGLAARVYKEFKAHS